MQLRSKTAREQVAHLQRQIDSIIAWDDVSAAIEAMPETKDSYFSATGSGFSIYNTNMTIEDIYGFLGKVKAVIEASRPDLKVTWERKDWADFKDVDFTWKAPSEFIFRVSTKPQDCQWVPVEKTVQVWELRCPGSEEA
jgi:hypothetical protein